MDTKLYVGNLPYTTTEDDLRSLFTQAGDVTSVALITDRQTGRSKGFAFVEMASQEAVENAISMFNGAQFGGRPLTVNVARPREERPRRSFSQGGGRSFDRSRNQGGGRRDS
jgi:RNA recognition motif-containing protein